MTFKCEWLVLQALCLCSEFNGSFRDHILCRQRGRFVFLLHAPFKGKRHRDFVRYVIADQMSSRYGKVLETETKGEKNRE